MIYDDDMKNELEYNMMCDNFNNKKKRTKKKEREEKKRDDDDDILLHNSGLHATLSQHVVLISRARSNTPTCFPTSA